MTWSCLRSNEFEFAFATFCTQSAEEFAARYETFHGCSSRVMGETGALGSVASLSTQAIDRAERTWGKLLYICSSDIRRILRVLGTKRCGDESFSFGLAAVIVTGKSLGFVAIPNGALGY